MEKIREVANDQVTGSKIKIIVIAAAALVVIITGLSLVYLNGLEPPTNQTTQPFQ